ncbi:hypothetical protein [Aliiglaciecola sp. LCG003]|uniref:hypothetical protein n=1 Tax=Aliiglaciecola sp. LCG003 TaxID=3053655 RepID=UPI002572FB5E|nr:hypothetical protein [Aliiglaciecola sp. LCG003]WJG08743.1 hypothetical protein QR722_15565 [Aliiglaciecola sp. LCG003]
MMTFLSQKYCRLIKPEEDWQHWSEEAENLHGISREMLELHGHAPTQICAELNQLLLGQTVYSDGWVVDYPWMIKLFYAARMPMKFTLSPLENILSQQQMDNWYESQEVICAATQCHRHRASSDAELIQSVYMHTQLLPQSAPIF